MLWEVLRRGRTASSSCGRYTVRRRMYIVAPLCLPYGRLAYHVGLLTERGACYLGKVLPIQTGTPRPACSQLSRDASSSEPWGQAVPVQIGTPSPRKGPGSVYGVSLLSPISCVRERCRFARGKRRGGAWYAGKAVPIWIRSPRQRKGPASSQMSRDALPMEFLRRGRTALPSCGRHTVRGVDCCTSEAPAGASLLAKWIGLFGHVGSRVGGRVELRPSSRRARGLGKQSRARI